MSVTGAEALIKNIEAYYAGMQAKSELAMTKVMAALQGWAFEEHGHPGENVIRGSAGTNKRTVENGDPHNQEHDPPFWDETGDTSKSISGKVVEVSGTLVRGVLSAGMDYDVFLELARNGKWAFLWPTIENHKDDIMKIIKDVMNGENPDISIEQSADLQGVYEKYKAEHRKKK